MRRPQAKVFLMKKLIAITVLLVLMSATTHAQIDQYKVAPDSGTDSKQTEDQPGNRQGTQPAGGDRLVRMQKRLGLSDEQVSQLRDIRQRGGSREEIRAVFTDEQWAMMQERRRQANARRLQSDPDRYYSLPPESQGEEADDG